MLSYHTRLLEFAQQFQKFYERQFHPVLERTHLTMREIHVLLFLSNNPSYDTARDITALRGLSKSQVSQAVDLLAAEGLVLRVLDRHDRRVVHLSLTPAAKPLAQECQEIQDHCTQQLLAALTPEEQVQFRTLLNRLLEGFPQEVAQ